MWYNYCMKLEFDLTIQQKQTLSMTPELIQAITILQYNAQELELYVEQQVQENPLLDVDEPKPDAGAAAEADEYEEKTYEDKRGEKVRGEEDFDWSEYLNEREYDDISYKNFGMRPVPENGDGFLSDRPAAENRSLSEHLMSQLSLACISERKKKIGEYVIESLDRNGYLTQTAGEIAETLAEDPARVSKVIAFIQTFDPLGVAAADLKESLILQINSMADGYMNDDDRRVAEAIIADHLDDLAANRISVIAKSVKRSVSDVQRIADAIRLLEPKPGRHFSDDDTRYILPDIIVEKDADGYTVSLNEISSPRLYVSPYYRQVLACEEKDSETAKFLTGRLNSALWLIKSIEQRNQTIYNVVKAIVEHQVAFFDKGEKQLRPLTLKKIADAVGVHESTVSRSV
ncbi:MAG: RNA polymerase factor sigma-54, partial [Clostridiales Family XIII bacterium]|nr:RNA polymerase factor sigma-54 [Clostridiales Family XIII bacterium]